MRAEDFGAFESLMRRFEKIFGKEIDDETMKLYFDALREIPFSIVCRRAEQYLKQAKFFPKPADLRPKEDPSPASRTPAMDAAFREGEERAIRNLEELRQRDPTEWTRRVGAAKGMDCNAIRLHRQYGNQLWYDIAQRCWRV